MILCVLFMSFFAHADGDSPVHRLVFEFPQSASVTIQKMQIDLVERNGHWFASTQSLSGKTKKPAYMPCTKTSDDLFDCERSDNGGGFKLSLKPTPKISVNRFCADDEGDEIVSKINSSGDTAIEFSGKKAVISSKDEF